MKLKNFSFISSLSLILLSLTACNALPSVPAMAVPTSTPQVIPATGAQYYFVTNKLLLPTTQEQTQEFALNIDADSKNHADNKFGELLTLLTSTAQGFELQAALDQAINTGQLVSLHVVKSNDLLNDPNVSWSIFPGQSTQSPPAFDGSDQLILDSSLPAASPILGALTNGHFAGGSGMTHIKMVLLGQIVDLDLIGVHLETDFSTKSCINGKIGGGISADEFRGNLLPAIAEGINQIVGTDQSVAGTLLPIFDSDGDGIITSHELENNPLLMIAISPDLDLLDESGNFNPGQDGIKDSYSAGLGFTCISAIFSGPTK